MKIKMGIISTTHLDLQNEKMSKNALDGMSRQIKNRYIPQLIEHDWGRGVKGVGLYAEVFKLRDNEYALGLVSGEFENKEEEKEFPLYEKNTVWGKYKHYLDKGMLIEAQYKNSNINKKRLVNTINSKLDTLNDLARLLEKHLNSTGILPNGDVYHTKKFIDSIGGLIIEVYSDDHPGHFHILSKQRKMNARLDINNLELISVKSGKIRNEDVKKIKNFFKENPLALDRLKDFYNKAQDLAK